MPHINVRRQNMKNCITISFHEELTKAITNTNKINEIANSQ